MSRRGRIRLISFSAALLFSLFGAIAACHVGAGGYTTRLDAQTTRAFGEAFSAVSRLQRSLDVCAYATDASMQSALCTQLFADAGSAETALSALPVELDALENLSRQISVAGDYAYLLSRTAAEGELVSQDALSALSGFSEPIHELAEQLSEIRESYSQGDVIAESRTRLMDSLDNLEEEADHAAKTLNDAFHDLAAVFPESEPLVYDGKFSDHAVETQTMLVGKNIISPQNAMEKAALFLQCDPSALRPLDFRSGEVPCWRFAFPDQNAVIAVTVRGGEVMQFLSDCPESGTEDPEQAERIAMAFLSARGYPEMESIETIPSGCEITMVFAPTQDEILCLPDRITMRICTVSGRVTAFDASDYLKHHENRVFPETDDIWTPPVTLSVESRRKVVLLSPGGQERFCEEYLCRTENGESVCIDVNAETGRQERIRIGEAPSLNDD